MMAIKGIAVSPERHNFSVQFTARDLSVRIDSVERLVQYTDNSVELLGQSTAPGTSKCRCFGGDEGAMTPILALT